MFLLLFYSFFGCGPVIASCYAVVLFFKFVFIIYFQFMYNICLLCFILFCFHLFDVTRKQAIGHADCLEFTSLVSYQSLPTSGLHLISLLATSVDPKIKRQLIQFI